MDADHPRMWTQDRFQCEGRTFSMPQRAVLPKPYRKPHPPMWVAVTSPGWAPSTLVPGSFAGAKPIHPVSTSHPVADITMPVLRYLVDPVKPPRQSVERL